MANYKISEFRSDILDRLDNAVGSGQISEAIRQKLQAPNRVLRAMSQAYYLYARQAEASILNGIIQRVALVEDVNTPPKDGLKTYLWPENAYSERVLDNGVVSLELNGHDRLRRETSALESVRMQSANDFYGESQEVFAIDQDQKRIYIPSDVVAAAKIIRTPQRIQPENEAVFTVTSNTDVAASSTVTIFTDTDSFVTDSISKGGSANQTASAYAGAINLVVDTDSNPIVKAIAVENKIFVRSLTNMNPKLVLASATGFTPAGITVNATGSFELPIHEVYGETLSMMAFRELIKIGTSQLGLESDNANAVQATQPSQQL